MTVAYMGSQRYDNEKKLADEVSKLVEEDNFGILLGAGSSKSAGGWIMSDVWRYFKSEYKDSYEWLIATGMISRDDQILECKDESTEVVGYLIDVLTGYLEKNDYHSEEFHKQIADTRNKLYRAVISAAHINDDLWNSSLEFKKNSKELEYHKDVLNYIRNKRKSNQPRSWIFTTNYDYVVEWSAQANEISIVDGFYRIGNLEYSPSIFNPKVFRLKGVNEDSSSQINLVKIHGSLSWEKAGDHFRILSESETHFKIKNFTDGRSNAPELIVYPGKSMYEKIADTVHRELLDQFEEFLKKTKSVLCVVGYGFGDRHINEKILSALKKSELKLVIYSPEFTDMSNIDVLQEDLRSIIALRNPRVTIVGGGRKAWFDKFSSHFTGS